MADIDNIRSMPFSLQAEQAILGTVIIDSEKFAEIASLKESDFYLEQHKVIYDAMFELAASSKPIDVVLVLESLQKSKKYDDADAVKNARPKYSVCIIADFPNSVS